MNICELIFLLSIVLLIILFGGEPDLMDAIINRITCENCLK